MYDPFYKGTYTGTREGSDWRYYWDEANATKTPSQPAADATYREDSLRAQAIKLFSGAPFYLNKEPFSPDYKENASGQYFLSAGAEKRGPLADATARHKMFYSRYHKSKYFCSTCHDVSNPVLANLAYAGARPGQNVVYCPPRHSRRSHTTMWNARSPSSWRLPTDSKAVRPASDRSRQSGS